MAISAKKKKEKQFSHHEDLAWHFVSEFKRVRLDDRELQSIDILLLVGGTEKQF
jgi:hypothetical protein